MGLRIFAFILGIFFLVVGLVGLSSYEVENGLLFKVYKMNLPIKILHIITGVCALLVAIIGSVSCRLYFQIVGIIYALLAIFGFIYQEENILGLFANNIYNTWMHVIVAILALVLGYGSDSQTV